ncbi:major facilitator superfamily domain-containing protein, partial [Globomyces pollinis-pini]
MTFQNDTLILLLSIIPEAFMDGLFYPLIPYILSNLNTNINLIPIYTGLLKSTFNLPLLFTASVWGHYSDLNYKNTKFILIISLLIGTIATLIIGLSNSIYPIFLARFLMGTFGSNSSIAKSMIAKLTIDQSKRSWAYSCYGAVYGIFGYLGLLITGISNYINPSLSNITHLKSQNNQSLNTKNQYSYVFNIKNFTKGTIFETFPFLSICLLASSVYIICLILVYRYLPEPNQTYQPIPTDIDHVNEDQSPINDDTFYIPSTTNTQPPTLTTHELLNDEITLYTSSAVNSPTDNPDELRTILIPSPQTPEIPSTSIYTWSNLKPIMLYGLLAYLNHSYATAIPIFFQSPFGLNLDLTWTSYYLSILFASKLITQITLFSLLLTYLKSTKLMVVLSLLLYIPPHLMLTILPSFDIKTHPTLLHVIMINLGFCEAIGYLSIIMYISEQEGRLGTLHGHSLTLAALGRTIAPIVAGLFWQFGLDFGLGG